MKIIKMPVAGMNPNDLNLYAQNFLQKLAVNVADFPAAPITALTADKAILNTQLGELAALIAQVNAKRVQVETACGPVRADLNTLGDWCEGVTQDPGKLAEVADLRSSHTPVTYGQITGLVVTPGDQAGQVHWMSNPQSGALYLLQTSPAQNPPVWTNQESSKKSKGDINGLPSLTRIMVRAAAKGSNNTGAWSDPAFVIVP